MNDILYGVQILNEHECGSFKRNSSAAPFSLFISFFSFFSFLFFVASLALSIYLSFFLFEIFCFVLFGIFCFVLFGSFLTLRATLYILKDVYKIFHTLQ